MSDVVDYPAVQQSKNVPCSLHPDLQSVEEPTKESSEIGHLSDKHILDPDNPILQRFQQTLKQHLLRHIERLKDDIFGYESEVKKTEALKDELGVRVYNEQQSLEKQQKMLDDLTNQLTTTRAACEETETVLKERRIVYKTERERTLQAEIAENETSRRLEKFNFLNKQLQQWQDDLESNLTIKQRIMEKSMKDKQQLLDEKRLQDRLIYNLMRRIWYFEQQLDEMNVQIKLKTDERDEMAEIVFHGNIKLEKIQTEYRTIRHSWNSLITTITNRNKAMNCLKDELKQSEDRLANIIKEIEQIQKDGIKEMQENEKLTILKQQILKNIRNNERTIHNENAKKDNIVTDMKEMQMIIEEIENNMKNLWDETKIKQDFYEKCVKFFEKLQTDKNNLDETILKKLEDQLVNDQATISLNRKLRELRETNRNNELNMIQFENRTSKLQTDIEIQKANNDELEKLYRETEIQFNDLSKRNDELLDAVQKNQKLLSKKQREFDTLSVKLQKLLEKTGGEILSPLQIKIKQLGGQISDLNDEIKELQSFWLREQVNLLQLSGERQEQVQKNNLLNKQIMLMEQKNLRITTDLENFLKKEQEIQRTINLLYNRLKILNENLCKTKDSKYDLDHMNEIIRKDYLKKLQATEIDCLNLEDEIEQITVDIKQLNHDLINLNREVLEWEKQYKLAKETKENLNREKSSEGEVGSMKAEIHRMSVRYSQLKKAQDKLIQDLESCVCRRDAIITVAEAREKRSKEGVEKTRFNFQRKLENMRERFKQMENEIKLAGDDKEKLLFEKRKLGEDMKILEMEIGIKQQEIDALVNDIEEISIENQLNFELLLELQKKLTMYNKISDGLFSFLHRTKSGLLDEYTKQRDFNKKLVELIESLMKEFPYLWHRLKRIMNTLKLPSFVQFI